MTDTIYKVIQQSDWRQAQSAGVFHGAQIDLDDGYIHFSTAKQVVETVAKHFRGQTDLLLLTVPTQPLGKHLKWERSRGDQLFPHLYTSLDPTIVIAEHPLEMAEDGTHRFPIEF